MKGVVFCVQGPGGWKGLGKKGVGVDLGVEIV
jgi:hypothetical protein